MHIVGHQAREILCTKIMMDLDWLRQWRQNCGAMRAEAAAKSLLTVN